VPALNPEMLALTPEAVVPEPRSCDGVVLAPLNELLVPYRNQMCVSAPFGFTVPPRVAELVVTEVAEPEVAVGACAAAVVVKLTMAPLVVPELF